VNISRPTSILKIADISLSIDVLQAEGIAPRQPSTLALREHRPQPNVDSKPSAFIDLTLDDEEDKDDRIRALQVRCDVQIVCCGLNSVRSRDFRRRTKGLADS